MAILSSLRYRVKELAYRTQYAELKERVEAASRLPPGTPGTLIQRDGTGYPYWYRVYDPLPGKKTEKFVCKDGATQALDDARHGVEFAQWAATQVKTLCKLEFQEEARASAPALRRALSGHPQRREQFVETLA